MAKTLKDAIAIVEKVAKGYAVERTDSANVVERKGYCNMALNDVLDTLKAEAEKDKPAKATKKKAE